MPRVLSLTLLHFCYCFRKHVQQDEKSLELIHRYLPSVNVSSFTGSLEVLSYGSSSHNNGFPDLQTIDDPLSSCLAHLQCLQKS